jgi:hypothetical protein
MREAFQRRPDKSVRGVSSKFGLPHSNDHDELHKRLKLRVYKLQLVQMVKCKDHDSRVKFALEMPNRIPEDETQLGRLFFGCSNISRLCGTVEILMTLINTSLIHRRPMYGVLLMGNKVIDPLFREAPPTVTGENCGYDGEHCFASCP